MTTHHAPRMLREANHGRDAGLAACWPLLSKSIQSQHDDLVRLRRRIHASPEASGHEQATTALMAQQLADAGLKASVMHDGIGVIADIDLGARNDSFIAIRA